jgi:Zn-dependent protease with chaperone function
MTHAHGGVLVALIAVALGALVGNLLVAIALPALGRRRLSRLSPEEMSRTALLGLALPALFGGLALAVVLSVPTLALRFPELDHCTANAAPQVCFIHGTLSFLSLWEVAGVATLCGALALALARELARLWRGHRTVAALVTERSDADVSWTDDDAPYAFTVGLLRPRIILASGLRALLSVDQLAAAVAHERAHVRHRDALTRVCARIVSFLLVAPLRRRLMELLVLGQEQRADVEAAEAVGSAALVAETLLAMYRGATRPALPSLAPALAGPALEERVRALCSGHGTRRIADKLGAVVVALCFCAIGAHATVHHSAEAIAGVLLASPVHAHADTPASGHSHIIHE